MNADAPAPRPPAILVVSADDRQRRALVDPLNRRYAQDYRIIDADTPDHAAAAIDELHAAGGDLALVLSDDASPTDDHESVFAAARRSFPDVRRGLVIEWGSWADRDTTEAVLELMSRVQIDYYVVRPEHTADESFHRAITDFLHEWEFSSGRRRRGFTVIGDHSQPRTHQLQSLLARGGVPAAAPRPELPRGDGAAGRLGRGLRGRAARAHGRRSRAGRPRRRGARPLVRPGHVAARRTPSMSRSSAPGRAASPRPCMRHPRGSSTLVLEGESIGGQAGSSSLIRNYLGLLARRLGRRAGPARVPAGVDVRCALRAHAPRRRHEPLGRGLRAAGRRGRDRPLARGRARVRRQLPTARGAGPAALRRRIGVLRRRPRSRRGRRRDAPCWSSAAATPPARRRCTSPAMRGPSRSSCADRRSPRACRST